MIKWLFLTTGVVNLILSIIVLIYDMLNDINTYTDSVVIFVICFGVFSILDKLDEIKEVKV